MGTYKTPFPAGAVLRRRHLPHWTPPDATHDRGTYFVTWRVQQGLAELAPQERDVVIGALEHFHEVRYQLIAAVVMNDHVHVLFTLLDGHTLSRVLHTWKSFTAHQLRRKVWQNESFDRRVRDEAELLQKAHYIANNPRKRWPDADDYAWVKHWVM
jgi:putative transposase